MFTKQHKCMYVLSKLHDIPSDLFLNTPVFCLYIFTSHKLFPQTSFQVVKDPESEQRLSKRFSAPSPVRPEHRSGQLIWQKLIQHTCRVVLENTLCMYAWKLNLCPGSSAWIWWGNTSCVSIPYNPVIFRCSVLPIVSASKLEVYTIPWCTHCSNAWQLVKTAADDSSTSCRSHLSCPNSSWLRSELMMTCQIAVVMSGAWSLVAKLWALLNCVSSTLFVMECLGQWL